MSTDRAPQQPPPQSGQPSRKTGQLAGNVGKQPRFPEVSVAARADPDLPRPDAAHPRAGVRVRRRRRLQAVAATQHGLFTTAQARDSGLDRRARHHHLTYGNWRRTAAPGVLRLTSWPADPCEDHRAWLLWGGAGAALTGWTGLELHRLTVAGPRAAIELRLPPSRTREEHRSWTRRLAHLEGAEVGVRPRPRIHRVRSIDRPTEIDGMSVVSPAEAMCVALESSPGIAPALMGQLIELGRLDLGDLVRAGLALGSTAVGSYLFGDAA